MIDLLAQFMASIGWTVVGRVGQEPNDLLHQPLRRRLVDLIWERPGIHASGLCRESGEPWGTVQYHLSLLDKGRLITSVEAGRERHFFPPETDPAHARLMALLNQGRRLEIAAFIREHPGIRQVDICDALDVSRKTFRSSIEPLVEEGLLHERKGLQSSRYFPQGRLDELMAESSPTLHEPGIA